MTDTKQPARWVEALPLSEIQRASRNAKLHDQAGITASVERFGFAELPLLDERTGRLVAGHGRIEALTKLAKSGAPTPAGVERSPDGEWLVPVLRGWASGDDAEAEAYGVGSNQLAMNGGWDQTQLTRIINDLATADMALAQVTGLGADLDALLRAGDFHGKHAVAFLAEDMANMNGSPDLGDPSSAVVPTSAGLGQQVGGVPHPFADDPAPGPGEGWAGSPISTESPEAGHAVASAGGPAQVPGQPYVQLTWVTTPDKREIIHEAIRTAQGETGATQIDALVQVCLSYTTAIRGGQA